MKRVLLLSICTVLPLGAYNIGDTVEFYLPQLRYSFAWDEYTTKAYIADTVDGAYIAVFRYNFYPYKLLDVPNFRDFPPTAWQADPGWTNKLEIEGSQIFYPAIKYTFDPFTGTSSLLSPPINLSLTNDIDTIVFTYILTDISASDSFKFMVAKASDTTCWDLAGALTSSDISTSRSVKRFLIPLGGSCGLTDNDTIFLKISFVDNSNVGMDSSKYFALYNISINGRTYRPYGKEPGDAPVDTLTIAKADSIVADIRAAWSGVKSAIDNFMGVSPSDLIDKDGNGRIIILVGPFHTTDPNDNQYPDSRLKPLLSFYDPFDINNAEIIYLNAAWGIYDNNFQLSDPDRIAKLRKLLAFYYAKYVAYSVDPSEGDTTLYPLYLINMNLSAKAAWIAHKALISSFDPDNLYSYAKGIFNDQTYSFAAGTDATYLFSTATLYDGRMARWEDISKFTLWLSYLEELTSEDEVKNAIRESDVLFMYLPIIPTSVLNLIMSRGKTFEEAFEEFALKVFAAGRPYISRISGFPTFVSPVLNNTLLSSSPPSLSLKAYQSVLYSATVFGIGPGSQWITFDGNDENFVNDTLSGYKVYLIDTLSNTFNALTLDERNRGISYTLPTFVMVINYGSSGEYVMGNKDTSDARVKPVVLEDFFVEPNYAFKRYVDVYIITNTYAYFDASFSGSADGAKVMFYPEDTARFGYTILTLSEISPNLYGTSAYLLFRDIADNPYYGPIIYKIYRLQSFAGFDYTTAPGVSDSGVIQSVKLGNELVEAYPELLFMRSLSSEKDLLVFHNREGEFAFSEPVDAEVRARAQIGDKMFVYDGIDWKEVETFYDVDKGEVVAYVSGAYRVYVGKDKPYTTPTTFKAFAEIGKVRVVVPYRSNLNLIIYGLSGRKIKEIRLKDLPAGRYEFDLRDLPKGVYMVKVSAGGNKAVVKVINGGMR